jgi:hypothetical protein
MPIGPVAQSFRQPIATLYNKDLQVDGADPDKPVKWDIPASITYYLSPDDDTSGLGLFFRFNDAASRITTGFQLVSGFFSKGVKKEDIAELADSMDWNHYDEKCANVKRFFDVLNTNKYLKTIRSWGKCLADIVSDGPTLNFLFLAFRSFQELGGPTGFENTQKKIFDKNVFILLDRAIYEYQCNLWKGSSDSTIAKNLAAFDSRKDRDSNGLFNPIPDNAWPDVISKANNSLTINGKLIVKDDLKPIVFFYYILKGINGKDSKDPAEVDHIMPQAKWQSVTVANKEALQNSLFNLALLPKSINGPKSNNYLNTLKIEAGDLADEVSVYEEIPLIEFEKFSNVSNYKDLKAKRDGLYLDAYTEKRKHILESA